MIETLAHGAERGRRHVGPRRAAVSRDMNQAVVGAGPNHRGIDRRTVPTA